MHDILNTPFTKSNTNTNTTNNNNISQLVIFTTFVIQSINIPSGTSHQLSFATTPAQLSDRSLSTCAVPLRGLTAGRLISPDPTDDALPPHGPTDDRYSHVTSSQFPYQESYSTQNVIAAALAVWEPVYHYIIIIMLHIYITTILHLYISLIFNSFYNTALFNQKVSLFNVYAIGVGLDNAATSRILVNPAVILIL